LINLDNSSNKIKEKKNLHNLVLMMFERFIEIVVENTLTLKIIKTLSTLFSIQQASLGK
jgi:hypothetical protein